MVVNKIISAIARYLGLCPATSAHFLRYRPMASQPIFHRTHIDVYKIICLDAFFLSYLCSRI